MKHVRIEQGLLTTYNMYSYCIANDIHFPLSLSMHIMDHCNELFDTHSDTCIQLTQFPDGKEGDGTARWKGQLKQYC